MNGCVFVWLIYTFFFSSSILPFFIILHIILENCKNIGICYRVDLTVNNELFKIDFWPPTMYEFIGEFLEFIIILSKISLKNNRNWICLLLFFLYVFWSSPYKVLCKWRKFICISFHFFFLDKMSKEQYTYTHKITAIAHKIRNMNIKCIVSRVKSIYRRML